ncbi:MAG: Xaa-Pro dipeptidase [Planctomycetota bacterium]|nr:Xaa-Pro dipeptidase [Planctomycetota bacterium]
MNTTTYSEHVATRQRTTESALAVAGFDAVVIQSGSPFTYFVDDMDAPFHPTPHFAHWTPLEGPLHLLHVRAGQKPRLVRVAPEDYWYEQAALGTPFWLSEFDVVNVTSAENAWKELTIGARTAYVGDLPAQATRAGIATEAQNPDALVKRLDWERSRKSAYEVSCIEEAQKLGARGHLAARGTFLEGGSELDIHHAFVTAVGCTDDDLPYPTIVALDEKGAILHYHKKRTTKNGRVLLADCGAQVHRYASDITRTWTTKKADPDFSGLVTALDQIQRDLCALVKPGLAYLTLHHTAHVKIADLLHATGLIRARGEDAVKLGLTHPFFPHGLGHFLGLQVHDVSGRQTAPEGGSTPPPKHYPFLRTTRTIEEGQVFTVEPGIYFVEMLLRPHRAGPLADMFAWSKIDALAGHGGIRIEDNVLVTRDGHRNLTRSALHA